MEKKKLVGFVVLSGVVLVVAAVVLGEVLSAAFGEGEVVTTGPAMATTGPAKALAVARPPANPWVALAIALSVVGGALGAGYAVAKVGSAALGAASERPELIGRALVYVVIAEGVAVWGLVGGILLLGSLR